MLPRDKYTLFDKKEKTYRKGIHSKSYYATPLGSAPSFSETEGFQRAWDVSLTRNLIRTTKMDESQSAG